MSLGITEVTKPDGLVWALSSPQSGQPTFDLGRVRIA